MRLAGYILLFLVGMVFVSLWGLMRGQFPSFAIVGGIGIALGLVISEGMNRLGI